MDAENAINLGKKEKKEGWKGRAISTVCMTRLPRTASVRYSVPPLVLLFLIRHVMQRCPVDVPIRAVPPMIKINIRRLHQLIPVCPGVSGGERDGSDIAGGGGSGVDSFPTSPDD